MKAMILAAGLGTRLKPFTDHHPKALAPVNGKPVLQRNIEYLQRHGIDEVIINVHHFAEQVVTAVEENKGWGSKITISDESDEVLETGGGILKAASYLQDSNPFVVMNADILTDLNLSEMMAAHIRQNPMGSLAVTTRNSSRALLFDVQNNLCGWANEKTGASKGLPGQPKAFSGIQILNPEIFQHIHFSGKFSMIDVYLDLCPKHIFMAFDHSQSLFMDIGTPEKLALAEKVFP
jgi:N-acetyl-alpha-D-muramate 1-phosphate uridylyltransferase